MPKLKEYVLPRIKAILLQESARTQSTSSPSSSGVHSGLLPADGSLQQDCDSLYFKQDRLYKHQVVKINYTTYDVRRSSDIIKRGRNIMVLAKPEDTNDDPSHPFWYARVLGMYHVNVIYTGAGSLDCESRRIDFLWVRWFRYIGNPISWNDSCLDRLNFPPMANDDAFGFVDPNDIIRGSHIIPSFAQGQLHSDGSGLSKCAGDAHDWRSYYINRYATYIIHRVGIIMSTLQIPGPRHGHAISLGPRRWTSIHT